MGRFIKLDTALTDITAPKLLHDTGVSGYSHRYSAEGIPQEIGSIVSTWPDYVDSLFSMKASTAPSTVTLQSEAGTAFVRVNRNLPGGGTLASTNLTTGPNLTIIRVSRGIVGTGSGYQTNAGGYTIVRNGNASYSAKSDPNLTSQVDGRATPGWAFHAGAFTGGAASYVIDADTYTGTVAQGVNRSISITSNDGAEMDLAELIVYPFTLTNEQIKLVRAALKLKYPALP